MGDPLRRMLYPLVLPAIVATVWAYALMMKHDGPSPAVGFSAGQVAAKWAPVPGFAAIQSDDAAGYGFRRDADGFATAAEVEE
jgi:hypothetical protein